MGDNTTSDKGRIGKGLGHSELPRSSFSPDSNSGVVKQRKNLKEIVQLTKDKLLKKNADTAGILDTIPERGKFHGTMNLQLSTQLPVAGMLSPKNQAPLKIPNFFLRKVQSPGRKFEFSNLRPCGPPKPTNLSMNEES